MGTLTHIHGQVDGAQRLTEQIDRHLAYGEFAQAADAARLLVRVIDGESVAACLECGTPLSDSDAERFTSWCDEHAPLLVLRFEE